jgi:low affinity Fe/Cu permease
MNPTQTVKQRRRSPYAGLKGWFDHLAVRTATVAGSAWAFGTAALVVLLWALTGPLFQFSDTWQLVINTGTTILTFLMVFLIQHTQNKESRAVQLKLNELIASTEGASNRLISIEDFSEEDLEELHLRFLKLVQDARKLRRGGKTTVEIERL